MGFSPPAPSWLLLAWAGGAATCAAALAGSLTGGRAVAPWSLVPRPGSRGRAALGTLLIGVLVYPAVYGVIFETMGRADVVVGLAAGAVHGALAALAAQPRRRPAGAARLALAHLVYVAVLSFLYVTP